MSYYSLISLMPKTSVDPDAQAFITAASITNPTQQAAINTLVVDLKGYNIWTKFKAIYPIVGGSASAHAVNLKTPGTYNLTFATGWTHSSTGMTPSNAFANTSLIPSSVLTNFNTHLSYYSRTQNTSLNAHDMGCETLGASNSFDLFLYYNGVSNKGFIDGAYPSNATQTNNTNTKGFQIGSRTTNNNQKLYFNGSLLATNTTTKSLGLVNQNLYIGATNQENIGASAYTNKECAFASIGDGLTDTEAANFYTAVQAYQTTLNRNV
jgi:hypothetical protein